MTRPSGWDQPSELILAMVTIGFDPGAGPCEPSPEPPLISWWDEIVTSEMVAAQ